MYPIPRTSTSPPPDPLSYPTMDAKPEYPSDYLQALSKRLSRRELDDIIADCRPVFVFNYLTIPSVLHAVITGRIDTTPDNSPSKKKVNKVKKDASSADPNTKPDPMPTITHARLFHHTLHILGDSDIPAVRHCPPETDVFGRRDGDLRHTVQGMGIFGLSPKQRELIYKFESDNKMMQLQEVHMSVPVNGPDYSGRSRVVVAETFVWKGNRRALERWPTTWWEIDSFLESKMYAEITGQEVAADEKESEDAEENNPDKDKSSST